MSVIPTTPGLQSTFQDDNEDLLNLLADDWQDPAKDTVLNSKWTRDYLTRLTSLSFKELLHEPQQLKDEQTKSIREAQQLAFREYPSFLHAQTCRHQVEETLEGLDVQMGEFSSSTVELPAAFKEFEQEAKLIKEERNKITSVLEHQTVLTDLLEIPQLMETCVRNGYYSEAMNLASHVRLLQVRYPLPVIKNIQLQVQASSDLMLVQLVSHLRKPIRLAAAMNVVGFLRRMDVFESETELRMVFLRCRHDYLQQRLLRAKRDISEDTRQKSSDAFEYLKRFIDVMREQMFEIGTQYISIFSNGQGTLLSDYMVHVMEFIQSALDTYLPMIEDTSALASLSTQLQYCGMSLGRIGLDFRHVFVHSFEQALQPMLLKWIDTSTEELVQFISKALEEGSAPSTWMSSKTTSYDQAKRAAFQPPMLLVGYPSLAVFTNGILSTFNALRLLPAISLFAPIQNHLDACFLEIGAVLKQYCDQAASRIPDEVTYLQSFASAYVRCCVPYLKSCLVDGIYGQISVTSALDEDMELLLVKYLPVIQKEVEKESDANLTEEDADREVDKAEENVIELPSEKDKEDTVKEDDAVKEDDSVKEDNSVKEENTPKEEEPAAIKEVTSKEDEAIKEEEQDIVKEDEPVKEVTTKDDTIKEDEQSLVEEQEPVEINEENPAETKEEASKEENTSNEDDTVKEDVIEQQEPTENIEEDQDTAKEQQVEVKEETEPVENEPTEIKEQETTKNDTEKATKEDKQSEETADSEQSTVVNEENIKEEQDVAVNEGSKEDTIVAKKEEQDTKVNEDASKIKENGNGKAAPPATEKKTQKRKKNHKRKK